MGTLAEDEKTMRLQGYVRVTNNSGEDYENAQTRLIVGKVHILDEIAALARRQYPYGKPGEVSVEEKAYKEDQKRARAITLEFARAAVPSARPKEIKKEGLSEYFLYTIEGTETIPTGWSKRLISFDVDEVPVINLYKYEQERYGPSVVRFLSFKNDEEHKLGDTPIPGGMLKVYRNVDEQKHLGYVGQSNFKYIPVDEDVELNLGAVADVVVEPTLMDFETKNYRFDLKGNISGWDEVRVFHIKVKNTRDIPIKVEIQRNFHTNYWEIKNSGQFGRHEKVDKDTVKYSLELGPRTEKTFSYVLTTRHKENQLRLPNNPSAVISLEDNSKTIAVTMQGLQFDGEKTYVEVKDHPVLDLTGPLTLAAWVNFQEGGTENPRIISKGWEVRSGYELLLIGTGKQRRFQFAAEGLGRFDSSSYLTAGTWHHLSATYDGQRVKLLLNGKLDGSYKAYGKIRTNDIALNFGRNSQNFSDRYKGQIAEVRLWRRALSAEEIRQNIISSHKSTSGLVGLWDFRQYRNADIVPDISGHGNKGKIVRARE